MPPNPPNKAHGFAMRSMSLRDMQISKSPKKILGPPLPNPGDAPVGECLNKEMLNLQLASIIVDLCVNKLSLVFPVFTNTYVIFTYLFIYSYCLMCNPMA